jgi:hypothetical protein
VGGENVIGDDTDILPHPNGEQAVAIALTEFHFFILQESRITAVSRITKEVGVERKLLCFEVEVFYLLLFLELCWMLLFRRLFWSNCLGYMGAYVSREDAWVD